MLTKRKKHVQKSDTEFGQKIFENIPNDVRPGWAGRILSRFSYYITDIPKVVLELFPIIDDKNRWNEAFGQFRAIRMFRLQNTDFEPTDYLILAESAARVTYHASGGLSPFDDEGHSIVSVAQKAVAYFDSPKLEEEVRSVILLFWRNEKLKHDLTTCGDFLLYKKIDDILWFDWDPIKVNAFAPRNEYGDYVPDIFRLVKAKRDRQEIANMLLDLEIECMGTNGSIENCLIIADKILV